MWYVVPIVASVFDVPVLVVLAVVVGAFRHDDVGHDVSCESYHYHYYY